jgi:exopolysaccharide biosynthesis WecB/TagA/CpsF family protein
MAPEPIQQVLGVPFFTGTVDEAVARHAATSGCLVIPAAPALIKLNYDDSYRRAMTSVDLALADSGLLVLLTRLALGRRVTRISSISYFKSLVAQAIVSRATFWIFGSASACQHATEWLQKHRIDIRDSNCFVATGPGSSEQDYAILTRIEEDKPKHVVIAMAGGHQEALAVYLRDYLLYRPAIHSIGAALELLSGEQESIPAWAERSYLGWLFRLFAQPRMFVPRVGISLALARMVFKYRSELPPLRKRWADV